MKKTIGIGLCMCSLLLGSQAFAASDDIAGHWAEKHLRALSDRGVMAGTGGNTYSPEREITRAEFATLLAKALELPASEKSFSDIGQADAGLQDGIKRAAGAGIVKGNTDGKFYPNNKISRQEMAAMLDNAMNYKEKRSPYVNLVFTDKSSIAYQDAVGRIVGAKLMTGIGDHKFGPEFSATRAMAAVVINKMLAYFDNGGLVPTDPPTKPPIELPKPIEEK
jgi:S-layer homology domain